MNKVFVFTFLGLNRCIFLYPVFTEKFVLSFTCIVIPICYSTAAPLDKGIGHKSALWIKGLLSAKNQSPFIQEIHV